MLQPAIIALQLAYKKRNVEEMAKCIQLDMECAALCGASSQLMCLAANMPMLFVNSVQTFARPGAQECNKHKVDHCKRCASICISCAEECAVMAAT